MTTIPLSEQERLNMIAMAYREAMAVREARESGRIELLAVMLSLKNLVDLSVALPALMSVADTVGDYDLSERIRRVHYVLANDYAAILNTINQLESPIAMPSGLEIGFNVVEDEPVEEPSEGTIDEPSDEPVEEPSEGTIDEPSDEPA